MRRRPSFAKQAKALIENVREGRAHYAAIVTYDDEGKPMAAVIVVEGQPQTDAILKAMNEVAKDWKDITEGEGK